MDNKHTVNKEEIIIKKFKIQNTIANIVGDVFRILIKKGMVYMIKNCFFPQIIKP